MKYGYKEIRKMHSDDLRRLCIFKNWYTAGRLESYENILTKVDNIKNITTPDLVEIAEDIYGNSDFDYMKNEGYSMNEIYCHIMFELSKICITIFE